MFVVFILSAFLAKEGNAQFSIAIGGGVTLNYLRPDANTIFSTAAPAAGYYFGANIRYQVSRRINVESGLQYLAKNYFINRVDSLSEANQHFENTFARFR